MRFVEAAVHVTDLEPAAHEQHAIDGPPVFLNWLTAQGARDYKYNLEHLRFESLSEAASERGGGD